MPKTVRIEVEKPHEDLVDCHMVVDDVRGKTVRLKTEEFQQFVERAHHEVHNNGSNIESMEIKFGK